MVIFIAGAALAGRTELAEQRPVAAIAPTYGTVQT